MRTLRLWAAVVTLAAFLLPGLAILATPRASPPLCRAQASVYRTETPGIFHVVLQIRTDEPCPPGGIARVRMESGRTYPWRTIRPDQPTTFRGVPCWWRASWESGSGLTYTIPTPGLVCPWGQP